MTHPVDDDVVMASAIGRCSNAWTHTENILARMFTSLTKTDLATGVTVFSFFKATRMQRDVLRKLARLSPFMTDELRDQLNKVLKLYLAHAERRNELLHNPIGRSVENQVYIMLREPAPSEGKVPYHIKPISPSEIDDLTDSIRTMNTELLEIDIQMQTLRFAVSTTPKRF